MVPSLHYRFYKFVTVRNILFMKILLQKKQQAPKLWALDDIDGLK